MACAASTTSSGLRAGANSAVAPGVSVTQAVGRGAGQGEQQVKSLNAARYSYFPLKGFELHIRAGRNLLAIEDNNNASSDSHDLFVDLWLLIER